MLFHRQIELALDILRQDSLTPQQGLKGGPLDGAQRGHPADARILPCSIYEAGEIACKRLISNGGP